MAKAKKKKTKKKAAKKKTAKKTSKKKAVKKKATKKAASKKSAKKKTTKKKVAKKASKKAAKKKTAKKKVAKKASKKAAKKATKKTAKKTATKKAATKAPSKKSAKKKASKTKATKDEGLKSLADLIMPQQEEAPQQAKPKKTVDEEGVLNIKGSEEEVLEALAEEIWGNEVDEDEVVLTDAEGNPYCRAKDCDQLSVVDGYCRYHYILLWKRIQNRKRILAGGKLDRYIEELTARYPDKYLEMLRKDLATEKDFLAIASELDIDESGDGDFDDDDTESYIQEMRGVSSNSKDDGDDY